MYMGEFIGVGVNNLFSPATAGANVFTICCVGAMFLVFLTSVFLFTDLDLIAVGIGEIRPFLSKEEQEILDNPEKQNEKLSDFDEVAKRIASDYHLSARESEVLPLLLAGRTIARIQDSLYISAGTVSTHIRHIYQKTGVERKQELLDLGEQYAHGKEKSPEKRMKNKA